MNNKEQLQWLIKLSTQAEWSCPTEKCTTCLIFQQCTQGIEILQQYVTMPHQLRELKQRLAKDMIREML